MQADVTIITPTVASRTHLLAEAIHSISQQDLPAKSHLIGVDLERNGPSPVRNKLFESVTTEWIGFLDDDDIAYPNHISSAARFFDTSDVVYTWCDVIGRDGFNPNSPFDERRLMNDGNIIPITAFVRSEVFRSVGGFDINARLEDWDLWKRLVTFGARFTYVPEITWCYRFLGNNRTFAD
jgi:hypothetical protein